MNQDYKCSMNHALNTGNKDFNLLEKINKIDYMMNWGHHSSTFVIELSFTWLDWRICDVVNSAQDFNVGCIDEEQQVQLCFNLFPEGRGILHFLAMGQTDQ